MSQNEARSSIRIVSDSRYAPSEGRVEVKYRNEWGTVCSQRWNMPDANVFCRQLGYAGAVGYRGPRITASNLATGRIWLKYLSCQGTENAIQYCPHNGWGRTEGCTHYDDAWVKCVLYQTTTPLSTPTSSNFKSPIRVRLRDGRNSWEGRLEVQRKDGFWGTVCDDYFDILAGNVVCRELGYARALNTSLGGKFPQSRDLPILLDDVRCTGKENSIVDCKHGGWGLHDCQHSEDVGVTCERGRQTQLVPAITTTLPPMVSRRLKPGGEGENRGVALQLRMVDSLTGNLGEHAGRIEILGGVQRQWGTICSYEILSLRTAHVICRQLGFPAAARAYQVSGKIGSPIWLTDVSCTGEERNIGSCHFQEYPKAVENGFVCGYSQAAGVECLTQQEVEGLRVRLVGGSSLDRGRIEVLYRSRWGSVCGIDRGAARTICRELGYKTFQNYWRSTEAFGTSTGPVWLRNVRCKGEEGLAGCGHEGWADQSFEPSCYLHKGDSGLACLTLDRFNQIQVRLQHGSTRNEGLVQVLFSHRWGSICGANFDFPAGHVICRMMGYSGALNFTERGNTDGLADVDQSAVWLSGLSCKGDEKNVALCLNDGWYDRTRASRASRCSSHRKDIKVVCRQTSNDGRNRGLSSIPFTRRLPVRLAGGKNARQGTVEIWTRNRWSAICGNGRENFPIETAHVVCRQLGFVLGALSVYYKSPYRRLTEYTWTGKLICLGSEIQLADCVMQRKNHCPYFEPRVVGVVCQ